MSPWRLVFVLIVVPPLIAWGGGVQPAWGESRLDCGRGVEVVFCPLRIPAMVIQAHLDFARAVMDHGETVALGVLEGVNYYGQLISQMADRITVTEALIVDVAEDLLPGVILARTLERGVANLTDRGGDDLLPRAILDSNAVIIRQQALKRPSRPVLLDRGRE